MICILCPKGCILYVSKSDNLKDYTVKGNKCKKGVHYGIKEMTNPTRMLTTTVKLSNSYLNRLPVRTNVPVPKHKIFDFMSEINKLQVSAPVLIGDILMENVLDSGINVISTRSI